MEEKLTQTVIELTKALSDAKAQEKKFQQRISDLEDENKSLENMQESDSHANERMAKITTSFTALEKTHLTLERKHEELLAERDRLKAVEEQMAQMAHLEVENMEYVETIAAQENELKLLQQELDRVRSAAPSGAKGANGVKNGKAFAAANAAHTDDTKSLHDRLSKLEVTSDELATENARLKNTVRTLTENLKAQWKKRDTKVQANRG